MAHGAFWNDVIAGRTMTLAAADRVILPDLRPRGRSTESV
jgi:hypothetical protein